MTNPKSNRRKAQEEEESQILELASSTLKLIYNDYEIDETQTDKPDKAIFLLNPPSRFGKTSEPPRIGIEITTADPKEYLSYAKERKKDKKIILERIEDARESQEAPTTPLKKIVNKIERNWIYEGVKGKSEKYVQYKTTGTFDELVLICFSDVLDTIKIKGKNGLKEWTSYLLSKDNFPFDKVLLVGRDNKTIQIYDKRNKLTVQPRNFYINGDMIASLQPGFVPMGAPVNIDALYALEPEIAPEVPIVERTSGQNPT